MAKLIWDNVGDRFYETGVSNGVLYPENESGEYPKGVAWNGLTSVSESPSGAEANKQYADNINYLTLYSAEEFGFTIEAFTNPDEFAECDGSAVVNGVQLTMQDRKRFGFVFKSIIGNDTKAENNGYKLHLIYCAKASPSDNQFSTINDSPEPITMSWECTTTPIVVDNSGLYKPTSRLIIDSTKADSVKLKALEDILFGTETLEARLPLPAEIISKMAMDGGH